MAEIRDHYAVYYADKLWALLPSIYRSEDSVSLDEAGPLRELVNRIGAQAAIIRRSIDRLWEDQSIESCDDWVIPYIADLLATNLVASLDARGQRLDVAKTIYYRRRKGTVGVLEEIASDVTGWEARVVEFFRRLARPRHGFDPPLGLASGSVFPDDLQSAQGLVGHYTKTSIGGFADLRDAYGATLAHGPFDEFFHYADFRHGRGNTGWHGIPKLGVFLWRLTSFGVDQTTPVPVQGCPNQYSFDPTGREIPLFASASRKEASQFGDRWIAPSEWQMPGPITNELYEAEASNLYPDDAGAAFQSLSVYEAGGVAGYNFVPRASVEVFPEAGRFRVSGGTFFGVYHYGFPSRIGAGPYDRRVAGQSTASVEPLNQVRGGGAIVPAAAGTTEIADSLTYTAGDVAGVSNAIVRALNEKRPVLRFPGPPSEWVLVGGAGASLVLEGLLISGADVVLAGEFENVTIRCCTLDPGTSGKVPELFAKSVDGRELRPARLWIEGQVRTLTIERCILGPVRTRGAGVVKDLHIADSIVQGLPEGAGVKDARRFAGRLHHHRDAVADFLYGSLSAPLRDSVDDYDPAAEPAASLMSGLSAEIAALLSGGTSIYTAERFDGVPLSPDTKTLLASSPSGVELARLNGMLLEDAFALELASLALGFADGFVKLDRVTVLGRIQVHQLDASETILDDFSVVEDPQRGCIRFSSWAESSIVPRKYESVRTRIRPPLFRSRQFGQPDFAQLIQTADAAIVEPEDGTILEGAQNGSEMGAYALEKNAIKERSVRAKFEEFMPLGLTPVLVHVT